MGFSPDSPPKRAGDYTRFARQRGTTLPPSTGSVVAVPFTADWGPVRQFVEASSFASYLKWYGEPVDPANPGEDYIAVYNAFRGEDDEHSGAGTVLCYRHAGAGVAQATTSLKAGATDALTLTARYEGTRGNLVKAEVVPNAASSATKVDLNLYFGTLLVEQYKGYGAGDIEKLAADITRKSPWVVPSGATNGTKLDAIAATALTGGNDGAALTAADWATTMEALEPRQFGYVAPANLTDGAIASSIASWASGLNHAEKSKRFFQVLGGALGESYDEAEAAAASYNDENVVRLGAGTYHDAALGLDLSTAQLAPRLAGIMSARGGMASLSFAYLQDLSIVEGPTEAEILRAIDNGVVVLSLGTGGVRLEKGVTTYTDDTDDKPFDTYSRIKYVTTMQSFERQSREQRENGNYLGRLAVNDDTREQLVSDEQSLLDQFVARKEVQPGAKVMLSPGEQSDDDEYIAIDWVGKFGRSLEQIRRTIYMS